MITKYIGIIALVVGGAAGSALTLYISKAVKPEIVVKTEKVVAPQCPPCNGIDWEKVKTKTFSPVIHQHLTINGDSSMYEAFRKIVAEEISKADVARCRGRK